MRDRGHGIAAADLPNIFDPFFSRRAGGTGLGLATSREIARGHGGDLVASSEPGLGSTFRLLLPLASGDAGAVTLGPVPPAAAPSPPPTRGQVILADDHDAVRTALHRQLEHLGLSVKIATTGQAAVHLYRQSLREGIRPLAVFLDLTFPGGLSGEEAAAAILAEDTTAFLIACSGYLTETSGSPPGFAAILPKPYSLRELHTRLGEAARHLEKTSPFAAL